MKNISLVGIITAIFIFLLPFTDSSLFVYGSINTKYFYITTFITLVSLYFGYLVFTGKNKVNVRNSWLLYLSIIVLSIYYISAFSGINLERSLWSDVVRSTGLLFISSVGVFSFVVSQLLQKADWKLIRRSVAFSATIFAILTFFSIDGFGTITPHGLTFGNTTFAGLYLLLGLVITLIELVNLKKEESIRKLFWVMVIIQLLSPYLVNIKELVLNTSSIISNPALLLGSARASGATAILAFIYTLGILFFRKFGKKNLLTLIWTVLIVVTVSVVNFQLFVPGSFVQDKYIESSTPARLMIWESGFKAYNEKPLLGWGPENFRLGYEKYLNHRLYLQENIGEVWFDRAHNFFVDTLVSVGIIGLTAILLLFIYFISIVYRAGKRGVIGNSEAWILGMLVFFHVLQSQTGFDTPSSYAILGLILGYGLWLERQLIGEFTGLESRNTQKIFAGIFVVVILIGSYNIVLKEFSRQRALKSIFNTTDHGKQIEFIEKSLDTRVGFEALRLPTKGLITGALVQASNSSPEDAQKISKLLLEQLDIYEIYFLEYLEGTPRDYRARMNYAHLLLIKTVLGESRADEAKQIIADSYVLSPDNPLTYVLDSLAYLYSGDLKTSKEKINEAVEIDPNIALTKGIYEHIQLQEKTFPRISVVNIENL